MNNDNQNNFEVGRVIVALCKECTYNFVGFCHEDLVFSGIDAQRVEILFKPKCEENNNSDIGAIILVHLKCTEKQTVLDTIEKLRAHPCVISAEPDYFIPTHRIPNDPYFGFLWGMRKISSASAWDYTVGSYNVAVGVLDSGVDYNHPDINGNLGIALDEDNFTGWFSDINSDNPMDETGHGTHVAGTIGAVGNNFLGVTGVCWNIRMASLKIGNAFFNLAAAIKAIDFANERNISILNNSWGGHVYSVSLKFAIDNYDGLFIVSAGNSGSDNDTFPVYPASFDSANILSVAATDPDDNLAVFSNYGAASVDIAAPGADILSTDLNGSYSYMSGTSMAAPHVAGAAALLKSYRPDLSALEIKEIILSSVDFRPGLSGKLLTGGVLNIAKMLEKA